MIFYMVGKLAPNSTHSTRVLVKYVLGRVYFRAVPSKNGDKVVTSPPPPPIVERVEHRVHHSTVRSLGVKFWRGNHPTNGIETLCQATTHCPTNHKG